MIMGILTARLLHQIQTPTGPRPLRTADEYETAQRQYVAARRAEGWPVAIFASVSPIRARISGGNWLVDCECGNAPLTDPAWRVAFCFACGAQHRDVIFPDDWQAIEAVLVRRPRQATRHWAVPETVIDLTNENREHGVEE